MNTVGFHDIEESLLTNPILLLEQGMLGICPCYVSSDNLMRIVRIIMRIGEIMMRTQLILVTQAGHGAGVSVKFFN